MDVLCIGQSAMDILIKPVNELDFKVDTRRVDKVGLSNGGDCMNTAINLAALGISVGFAGMFGDDYFGEILKDTLEKKGIDIRGLKTMQGVSTSTAVGLINSAGERTFFYLGGSSDLFAYEHVDTTLIPECRIVHIGGTYALPRFDGEGTEKVFRLAREQNKITSMDVTTDITGRWLEIISPSLKYIDYFMPSYEQAVEITKKEEPKDIADFLLNEGVKTVVLKLGNRGCYVKNHEQEFYQKAYNVNVVDTTGAGDSFVAGFITGILKNWDLKECARFASAVAAHCVQHLGATGGVPGFNKIIEFMNETIEENEL